MKNDKELPKTVEEAVDWLIEEMDQELLQQVRDAENLVVFHFGLGLYIRNQLGIYNGNEALLQDIGSRDDNYFIHPDSVSSMILDELQKKLRKSNWEPPE